jgi:hypothetical protein
VLKNQVSFAHLFSGVKRPPVPQLGHSTSSGLSSDVISMGDLHLGHLITSFLLPFTSASVSA